MEELIDDFVAETRETLEALGAELAAWQAEPQDRARLDAIFRCFHTLKAGCGLFGLSEIEALAAAAEDLLADAPSGKRAADPARIDEVRTIACRIAELVQGRRPTRAPRAVQSLSAWLPPMVTGLAGQLGKQVLLEVEAADVEPKIIKVLRGPLTHLVRNAIDHGIEPPEERIRAGKGAAGSLRVVVCRAEDEIIIEVADDGRGIDRNALSAQAPAAGLIGDEEATALVFAPGLSTAREVTSVSGRGVGMDAVRTDIELIGGAVAIESRRGCGVKITMRIPLTGRSRAAPAKSCLVVDDSRVMRKVARQMLESLGYAVEEAGHGREALARIEAGMPDLVLLDWNMPEMGGREFLQSLRSGGGKLKVVVCTSGEDPEQVCAAMHAGADGYLSKPFDRKALRMLEPSAQRRRAA
jgi:chemotaxis protein histidine kinase CheA/CheY-like chemotaxis protein